MADLNVIYFMDDVPFDNAEVKCRNVFDYLTELQLHMLWRARYLMKRVSSICLNDIESTVVVFFT